MRQPEFVSCYMCVVAYVQYYTVSLTNIAVTVRGSNPGGGEIFRTNPDRPWGPPSLLYNGYRVSFTGGKAVGA